MKTQLLIVEGIWGSGKTTLVDTLKRHLNNLGFPIRTIYDEDDPIHPGYDTGLCSADEFVALAVERLDQLVKEIQHSGEIALLEAPFLNCVLLSFLFYNWDREKSIEKTLELAQRVAPLRPVLIHLYHSSTDISWKRTCATRGEEWEKFMEEMLSEWRARCNTPFRDMPGFLRELRSLSDRVFELLPFPKLAIETSSGDWPRYYSGIAAFLQVPPMEGYRLHEEDYVGIYKETGSSRTCEVSHEEGILRVKGLLSKTRALVPYLRRFESGHVSGDTESFVTPGMSIVEIRFLRDSSGEIEALSPGDHVYGMPAEPSFGPLKGTLWKKRK